MMRLDKMTRVAFDALEDVKGRDIQVFNVKSITAIFDTVIVATGDSNRQCRALANRVQEMVKAAGGKIYGVEGEQTGEWLLVDIGATVIHIMQPAIRQYYNLEELWAPAPKAAKVAKAAKPKQVAKPSKPSKATKTSKTSKTSKATAPRKATKSPVARAKRTKA